MKTIKILSLTSAIIMLAMIVFSFITGNFFEEGAIIGGLVWGQMSLVDLYVGFFLVYLWIFYKESSTSTRIIWAILLVITGSLATAVYIYLQSRKVKTVEELLLNKSNVS